MRRRARSRWLPALAALGWAACAPAPAAVPGPVTAAEGRAVVLVSLDGFRWDYLDRPEARRLRALAATGVRADALVPSFPTKTFPNHYTIVTGLYPAHHGMVANRMWDPDLGETFTMAKAPYGRWWGGEPIWVTAERQGKRAAAMFWPGSEAVIAGYRPTFWERYDGRVPNAERVDRVLAWLRLPPAERPAMITLYFSDTDNAGHDRGPDPGPELSAAIARVDSAVGRLLDGIAAAGLGDRVDVIVVGDHGMVATSPERVVYLDDYIDLDAVTVVDPTPAAALWPKPGREDEVMRGLAGVRHARAWRKDEIPERLHYRDSRRIAPILVLADEGWSIGARRDSVRAREAGWYVGGTHGYDDTTTSMRTVFVAAGPSFARGARVPAFRNVHVYPLLTRILGLEPAPNDGSLDSVRAVLRPAN